jgi:Flp pilus assembly protein TadG
MWSSAGRVLADRKAVAAMEFALVAVPFLALFVAIIETSGMLLTQTVLEGGVATAARLIRIGSPSVLADATASQATIAAAQAAFTQQVCSHAFSLLNCSNLYLDVNSASTFGAISQPALNVNSQGQVTNANFNTGDSGSAVIVRAVYTWHTTTPFLNELLGMNNAQTYPMQYTVVMRNEPF